MLKRLLVLTAAFGVLTGGVAGSTTVIPPTFDALVAGAGTIFVAEVIGQRAEWEATPHGRSIVTYVTFRVEDVWKGAAGAVTQLEFLGGTIGNRRMEVVGMPVFRIGQRDVLFVSSTVRAVSPLVGFMHGRMRIERDVATGVDRVRTYDGRSLGSVAQVGARAPASLASITPMRLSDLAAAVRVRLTTYRAR